jgi:hypothetical protein
MLEPVTVKASIETVSVGFCGGSGVADWAEGEVAAASNAAARDESGFIVRTG